MEKRTLLAVVLSILVIIFYAIIQGIFFPPPEPQTQPVQIVQPTAAEPSPSPSGSGPLPAGTQAAIPVATTVVPEAAAQGVQRISVNTGLALVTLSNVGGDIVSYRLTKHKDRDDLVEMILPGDTESHAFTVSFGNINAPPLNAVFNVNRVSDLIVEFYQQFSLGTGSDGEPRRFKLTKRYEFKPQDYMFELTISLDGDHSIPGYNFSGWAYSLGCGPQIGPKFGKLDNYSDYRVYYTYVNSKLKEEKAGLNPNSETLRSQPKWGAVAGKYFTVIALPFSSQYEMALSTRSEPGIPAASRLYILRPFLNTARAEDKYRFYLGPKDQASLTSYNTGNNGFNLRDQQLQQVARARGFFSIPPVEALLKQILMLFHRVIPNYGVAIILLTILVKALFFPLTKKSSESTQRMQTLAPKIKEIQAKYKDNPQKMNAEMAEFYKKEGYNPVAGCLPMLLQLPIFFAMYNLFNNHFDLRGAMFIPGWIPDLSLPESVWNFAPFQLPILGWSNLRLLPFIYVGSQLLYGKFTQTPDQQGNTQMKLMLYAMPVIFFFILYDVPSGLLLYWIMSNVLTMIQQIVINNYIKKRRAAAGSEPAPVIAPKKRKRR